MIHTTLSPEVIARLPSPKGVALALTKACRMEGVQLQQIADLVQTDPALSGRLLAVANAAASGGPGSNAIDEAVSRVGLTGVSQIALAFSLIDQHASGFCSNFNYAGFWNQSLLMAAACREFGTPLKLGTPGELFTVGLLAQVGRLALATAYPLEYSGLVAMEPAHAELLQGETEIAGLDHHALSVALMEHWGIDAAYAQPFGQPAGPVAAGSGTTRLHASRSALAHAAWRLAPVLADEGMEAVLDNAPCAAALAFLQLSPDALLERLAAVEGAWRLWLSLMARPH